MNKKLAAVVATGLALSVLAATPAAGYLSDITGHWAAAIVTALEAKGIVIGGPDGRFAPDRPLARAELAKLLVAGLGYEPDAQQLRSQESRFADVPAGHWARGYVEVAAELGLVEGDPGGRFRPDDAVTRAEMAAIAVRAAGLAERARLSRTETTPYVDDAAIPSWARGIIFVARAEGLMTGLPDGRFYPGVSVTRAEGAAVVYRLLARSGSLFQLGGTLVQFDPATQSALVRDAMGEEHAVHMAFDAVYLRGGAAVPPFELRVLDQVFLILDSSGVGRLLEARYQDLLADQAQLVGDRLELLLPSGEKQSLPVLPGALIMINGHPAEPAQLQGAGPVYAAIDEATGQVRLVAALKGASSGIYIGPWENGAYLRVVSENQDLRLEPAPDLVVLVNDRRAGPEALLTGDLVTFARDESGRLSYIEVTR